MNNELQINFADADNPKMANVLQKVVELTNSYVKKVIRNKRWNWEE